MCSYLAWRGDMNSLLNRNVIGSLQHDPTFTSQSLLGVGSLCTSFVYLVMALALRGWAPVALITAYHLPVHVELPPVLPHIHDGLPVVDCRYALEAPLHRIGFAPLAMSGPDRMPLCLAMPSAIERPAPVHCCPACRRLPSASRPHTSPVSPLATAVLSAGPV